MKLSEQVLAQRRANVELMAQKKRARTKCKYGHPLDGKRKDGSRFCKTCHADARHRSIIRLRIRLNLDKNDKRHGTYYAYSHGRCHCVKCRIAASNRSEERRAA